MPLMSKAMESRRIGTFGCVLALLVLGWTHGARAEPIREPGSGQVFEDSRQLDGQRYSLIGVGLRKKLVFKVYALGLYVEDGGARRAFPALAARVGGRDHKRLTASDHATKFVVWGQYGKLAVMRFVRSVGLNRIRGTFEDALTSELSDKAPAELRQAAQAFLALFDRDVKNGDEVRLQTWPDGRIELDVAGAKKVGPTSLKLQRALWNVWLGPKPVSADLRRALIDRIDVLGR